MSKSDIDTAAAVLGIAASLVTIYQGVKKCPCDGSPLPFKAYCSKCDHNHYF